MRGTATRWRKKSAAGRWSRNVWLTLVSLSRHLSIMRVPDAYTTKGLIYKFDLIDTLVICFRLVFTMRVPITCQNSLVGTKRCDKVGLFFVTITVTFKLKLLWVNLVTLFCSFDLFYRFSEYTGVQSVKFAKVNIIWLYDNEYCLINSIYFYEYFL